MFGELNNRGFLNMISYQRGQRRARTKFGNGAIAYNKASNMYARNDR